MDLTSIRNKTNKKLSELELVRKQYKNEKEQYEKASNKIGYIQTAQQIIQQIAQQIQEQAHNQIASVVTKCLEAVFDEPYTFRILFEKKRGRTEARLIFERDGMEIDPMTGSGGGVIDVASFALRLSCLMLCKPQLRKILILDEPFKFVSEEYRRQIKLLLEQLSEEMKVQFIIITHINELKTGKIISLN